MIAGERPSGAIRAVHAGREADDQQPRRWVAERRHRLAEIVGLLMPHRIEKSREARAAPAVGIENLFMSKTLDCQAGVAHGPRAIKKRATRISA